MIHSRTIRRAAFRILVVLSFLITIAAGFSFCISRILESSILPGIAERAGIEGLSASVQHIGFYGADIGPFNIDSSPRPTRLLDSMHLRYSPGALFAGHVESVVIKGIALSCEYRDGELSLQGLDLGRILGRRQERDTRSESAEGAPPLSIGRIDIERATVSLRWKGHQIRLPIDLAILPVSPNWQSIDLKMRLFPRDQALYLSATIDLNKKAAQLAFNGKDLHPNVFSDITGLIPGLAVYGSVEAEGSIQMRFDPFQVRDSRVSICIRKGHISYNGIQLSTGSDAKDRPFQITLSGKGKEWDLSAIDIAGFAEVPFHIPQMTSRIIITDKGLEQIGDGTLIIASPGRRLPLHLELRTPITLPLQLSSAHSEDDKWSFSLLSSKKDGASSTDERIHLTWDGVAITAAHPQIAISATKGTDAAEGNYSLTLTEIKALKDDATITIPKLTVSGQGHLNQSSPSDQDGLSFTLAAADIKMAAESTQIHLPRVLLYGRYNAQNGSSDKIMGTLSFSGAKIFNPTHRMVIDDIQGAIPLAWPLHRPGEKGNLTIGRVRWQDLDTGSLGLTIQQDQDGFIIDGEHTSALFPELSVGIKGKSSLQGASQQMAEVDFDVAQYRFPSDLALGKHFPAFKDVIVTGTLDAHLKLCVKGTDVTGTLNGKFTDGSMGFQDRDWVIEGIHGSLFLPDLPKVQSASKQHLRFEKASFGTLRVTDGRIDFQIESADSVFIEKSSLKWGGGNLYTHAMRIQPGNEDYSLTVYCDRLNLARLLEQIGSVRAEGSGTVNGRIPLRYRNGKLGFEDGFLYSTPGDGGSIRVTQTEILTAGIPQNTSQYAQLELAREALKDYDYKWVKLNLETKEEILLMGMQLDGKPVNPLPFVYKKELGGFARIEAGGKGSIFQGIGLEVNFKVPLDKILHYGDPLKSVFGGSR